MGDGIIADWLCSKQIKQRDILSTTNKELGDQIAAAQTEIANLEREKADLIKSSSMDKQALLSQIDGLNGQISALNVRISELNAQLNQSLPSDLANHSPNFYRLPQSTQVLLDAYMNKYPEGNIVYNGRFWGQGQTKYELDVKAWLMEGQNNHDLVSLVKSCRGRVSDILKDNPDLTFHQACDKAFMKITNVLCDSVQYTYDQTIWNCQEFWQFASETHVIGRGDCEDKAIAGLVGAIIAGIPFEMLRLVAGTTFSDEGHCTMFYFASDLNWHHRNSTTNYPADKDPKALPLTGDSSENLNIKRVWFSATQNKTFTTFSPTAANNKEKKDEIFKFLRWLE